MPIHRSIPLALIVLVHVLAGCVRSGKTQLADVPPSSPTLVDMASKSLSATVEGITVETEPGLTRFGVLAVLPESSGSTSDPLAVTAVAATGAGYMRASLDWAYSEPQPGQISYETRNDAVIRRIEGAGLRVFPTLYVGSGWMNASRAGGENSASRSYPPDDLEDVWNDRYGYSASYFNFLTEFFQHYRGHFDFVAIENEANSNLFWGGSADEYVRLIKTAYKAIKAADPHVTVVDSGFVSSILGLCIAEDYLRTGGMTEDQAVRLARDYYRARIGGFRIQTWVDLERVLNLPRVQEQCRRINYILDHIGGAVDAVNFHFYEDYRELPVVAGWLRSRTARAGYTPRLVTNELGTRGVDSAFAKSAAQARDVFKKLITAISLRLTAVVWFSADTFQAGRDKVGIFDPNGAARPAARTLELVIGTIGPDYRFRATLSAGPSLYHHVFADPQGSATLEVLWTEEGFETLELTAPAGSVKAVVLDYSGRSQILDIEDGSIHLILADAPVFVLWE